MSEESESPSGANEKSVSRNSLIFISHDTRDAPIAEAFSSLLKSVSAGVLKSFRSSDKKGNQGIEFGVEWYPEIMKKLEVASDVVCLLTPNSVNRPWILYEAGVAKGKLETPVHGVALGIALQAASSGPFAQFQNSDDSEESLTQLVMQLVSRIPNAEPDRDVVKTQVSAFKKTITPMFDAQAKVEPSDAVNDEASVAKIFEEIKVMFQDLPSRIERRIDPRNSKVDMHRRHIQLRMMDEFIHVGAKELGDSVAILFAASQFRDEFPWLYDIAVETFRKVEANSEDKIVAVQKLSRIFEWTMRHPYFRDMNIRSKERMFAFEESLDFAMHSLSKLASRLENENDVSTSDSEQSKFLNRRPARQRPISSEDLI